MAYYSGRYSQVGPVGVPLDLMPLYLYLYLKWALNKGTRKWAPLYLDP